MIGMHIDAPTGKEDDRTDDELRRCYPSCGIQMRIILRRKVEQPITLDITVNQVPRNRKQHDDHRHFALAFEQEREYERTLEIMEFKNQKECPIRSVHGDSSIQRKGLEIQIQDHQKYRALHEQPTYFVIDGRSPFLRTHLAVAGVHEIQRDENYQAHNKHDV